MRAPDMSAEERGRCDMNGRYRVAAALAAGLLLSAAYAHTASAWSWTNDEAGEKLDREARRWLTTQNVCGVQLKPDYLKDLDTRIVSHFTTMADDYRQFLLSSVWTANAEFLNETRPPEIKKVCEVRTGEAAKAGVLADFNPVPYRWAGATVGSPSASAPSVAPAAPPKPSSYLGTWAAVGVTCAAVKNHTDERGVTFTAKEAQWYESSCRIRSATGAGSRTTIVMACSGEGETFRRTIKVDQLSANEIRIDGGRYNRCD